MKATKQPTYEETVAVIATNIQSLAKAVEALLHGPLKRRALVILLASSSRLSQQHVEAVLGALETLNKDWLNQ
jgi:spore germination protein GerM